MENKNASWIKGPLPPLAESILMSGLVSNKGAPSNSIIVKSASSDSLENINLHPSVSHTIGNRTKHPQKINTTSPAPNPKDDDNLSRTAIVSTKQAKSTFVSPQKKRSSISSASQYKNQTDRINTVPRQKSDIVFVINPKNGPNHNISSIQSSNIHESFGMNSTISSKRYSNASIGESTSSIVSELDANIALLNNPDNPILSQACSDEISFKEQLVKIHNYSFNQLILHEKSICSDRALLLRRFMKFYNSLIEEIPEMHEHIKQEESTFSETIEKLKKEKEEIEEKYQFDSNIEKELRNHIEKLEEMNKELTEESNKKDLTISSTTFETDYLKGQIVQLQFKLQNKKQRRKMLKKAISQMEEESKNQLNQIDSLTKALEEMNQGETGYIQKYHRVQTELEEAKKEIADLKFQINNVPVIEKADISVDTSDLPPPTKKKSSSPLSSQIGLLEGNNKSEIESPKQLKKSDTKPPSFASTLPGNQFKRPPLSRRQSTNVISPSMIQMSSILAGEKKKTPKNNSSLPPNLPKPKIDLQEMFQLNERKVATIQTSPRLAETLPIVSNAINYNNVNFSNEKTKTSTEKLPKEKSEEKTDGKYHSKVDKINFLCPLPDNYKIDEKTADSVPDILKMIMPILSRPYVGRHPNDLKILDNNITTQHQIVSNQKPLVWALQLIHNFLLDPYLRSNEHLEKLSVEPIFIDWITSRYKLQHLVNQVITDFSSLLVTNRCISAIMSLFYDLLEGQYTITELSFFSTLYSFSNQFTYPSLPKCLEEMTIESSGYDQFSIHIKIAYKLFAKCFTNEIADSFMLSMAEKIKEKEESPLINYFEFLKNSMEFFGEKHKTLYLQSKNLLMISGCTDPLLISYDPFVTFMTFLDYNGKDLRKEWKAIKSLSSSLKDDDKEKQQQDTVQLRDLMGFLAEKETQFVNLLNIIPMGQSVLILKSFSSVISNLFIDLMKRFMKIKKLQSKLSEVVNEKIKDDLIELKTSYLCANIPRILWYYKTIMMKVDKYLLKEKGYIPFHPQSSIDVIKQLVEYLDRTESVSFALLS